MPDLKSCRILVTPTTFGSRDPSLRRQLEATVGEVIYNDLGRPLTSDEVRQRLRGIDGYIAGLDTIDEHALEGADRLKVIARYGVGLDRVDQDAARAKSIVIANTPNANSISVAELTIGLMISLARHIPQSATEVRNGRWPRRCGTTLQNKTVGLIGFGSIGNEVARRLASWDCKIVASDPYADESAARELQVALVSTQDLLQQADFVSLHLPLFPETFHLVDDAFLCLMKREAFLINTARGELIDDLALGRAIESGRISGAALDVFPEEPPGSGSRLIQSPEVIATPHCGAHTDGAINAMGWAAMRACISVLENHERHHAAVQVEQSSRQWIKVQERPTMYFIGVTTRQSSMMKIFPLWMQELGRPDVVIEGVDFRLHDSSDKYRRAILQIKCDQLSLGALVTSHKISLFEAGRDLFGYLDPYATTCGEVSCISKENGVVVGHAKDPISAGLSLDALLGQGYFDRTGGHVLCMGAGGSATAIAMHLAMKKDPSDRPKRIVIVNRSSQRCEHLSSLIAAQCSDILCEFHPTSDPEANDKIMADLPEGSLVINATGMGKDTPGSPFTDRAQFPRHGIVWELNYRGELDFLHQALAQAKSRRLIVEDGWLYFLHGWTQVIAQVLGVTIEGEIFDRLSLIAQQVSQPALAQRVTP